MQGGRDREVGREGEEGQRKVEEKDTDRHMCQKRGKEEC